MKNLAIECSGTAGSVGISDDGPLLSLIELDAKVGSVQTLAPQVHALIKRFGRPHTISVTVGPGSFTGLRVGLTMAKMLGYAWKIPIIAVDTLHAIALRAVEVSDGDLDGQVVFPVINAFRGQLFATAVSVELLEHDHHLRPLCDSMCVVARQWCEDPYQSLGIDIRRQALFTGPGLANYLPNIGQGKLTSEAKVAQQSLWQPTAREVDVLGRRNYSLGKSYDSLTLPPAYIRASAAEEKARQEK